MYQTYNLSHADAMKVIAAIQQELERQKRGAAVAVADAHGELLAFLRTDGCPLASIVIAMNKRMGGARFHVVLPLTACAAEEAAAAAPMAEPTPHETLHVLVVDDNAANRFVAAHSSETRANEGLAEFRDDLSPAEYAGFVHEWIASGATLLGGCCGMEPAHIAALAALPR